MSVDWDSAWGCVSDDGHVTRPAYGQADSTGIFAIKVCYPSDQQGYYRYSMKAVKVLTVLAYKGTLHITGNPEDVSVPPSVAGATLSVEASRGEGETGYIGETIYQWYEDDDDTPGEGDEGEHLITGATSANYAVPALESGSQKYFCKVSALDAAPVFSRVATVTVDNNLIPSNAPGAPTDAA